MKGDPKMRIIVLGGGLSNVDRLYRSCPDDVVLIAASGMRDAGDVARLPERVNGREWPSCPDGMTPILRGVRLVRTARIAGSSE